MTSYRARHLREDWTPERLQRLLDALGITAYELARRRLQMNTESTVYEWLSGKHTPSHYYGIQLDALEAAAPRKGENEDGDHE